MPVEGNVLEGSVPQTEVAEGRKTWASEGLAIGAALAGLQVANVKWSTQELKPVVTPPWVVRHMPEVPIPRATISFDRTKSTLLAGSRSRTSIGIYKGGLDFPELCAVCGQVPDHREVVEATSDYGKAAVGNRTVTGVSGEEAERLHDAIYLDRFWFAVPFCGVHSAASGVKLSADRIQVASREFAAELARRNGLEKAKWQTRSFPVGRWLFGGILASLGAFFVYLRIQNGTWGEGRPGLIVAFLLIGILLLGSALFDTVRARRAMEQLERPGEPASEDASGAATMSSRRELVEMLIGNHFIGPDDQRVPYMGATRVEWREGERPKRSQMRFTLTCHQCGTDISGELTGYTGFTGGNTDPCRHCGNRVEVGNLASFRIKTQSRDCGVDCRDLLREVASEVLEPGAQIGRAHV